MILFIFSNKITLIMSRKILSEDQIQKILDETLGDDSKESFAVKI